MENGQTRGDELYANRKDKFWNFLHFWTCLRRKYEGRYIYQYLLPRLGGDLYTFHGDAVRAKSNRHKMLREFVIREEHPYGKCGSQMWAERCWIRAEQRGPDFGMAIARLVPRETAFSQLKRNHEKAMNWMRKIFKKAAGNKGLTLIEIMVAMVILTCGVVAGMMVLVEAQKSNSFARAKTMAINESEQQMEAIFRDAPSAVTTYNNVTFSVGDLMRPGGVAPGLITVSAAQPHLVTVSVTWQGRGTLRPGTVVLRTLRDEATR